MFVYLIVTIAVLLTQYFVSANLPDPKTVSDEEREILLKAFRCEQSCEKRNEYPLEKPDPFNNEWDCPIFINAFECVDACGEDIARIFKQHANAQFAKNEWILNECFANKSTPEFEKYVMRQKQNHSELSCAVDCLKKTEPEFARKTDAELEVMDSEERNKIRLSYCDPNDHRRTCLEPCGEAGAYLMIIDTETLHRYCVEEEEAKVGRACTGRCTDIALDSLSDNGNFCDNVANNRQCFMGCNKDSAEMVLGIFYQTQNLKAEYEGCAREKENNSISRRSTNWFLVIFPTMYLGLKLFLL